MKYCDDTPSSLLVLDEENPMFPKIGIWSISLKFNSFDIIILYDTTNINILFQYFQVEQDYIEAQDTALPEDDEDL